MPDAETDSRARDATASDAAHELGNRLAAIVAFSHLIRTDPRLPADLHHHAELLIEEANRTQALVEQILQAASARETAPSGPALSGPALSGSAPSGAAAAQTARPQTATQPATPPATGAARILVVDDEPAIRDFLARVLRRLGHEAILAADGAEALAIVRSDSPDAILCDHRMAGMTGAAFNDAVAERSPQLARRFAFMTGDAMNSDLRAVADARGAILLAKPFDVETVERTVERILAVPAD